MTPARSSRSCTFRTRQNKGVWQVSRDGLFYGDYESQAQDKAEGRWCGTTSSSRPFSTRAGAPLASMALAPKQAAASA
jgi:hypothetical protein